METDRANGVRTFEARNTGNSGTSGGWRLNAYLIIAGLIIAPALIIWLLAGILPSFVPPLVTGILVLVAIMITVPLFIVSSIGTRVAAGVRYEVSDRDLTMIGGPVRYTVPLDSIKRVYTRDFDLSLSNRPMRRITGVRMPNLALGPVQYKDTGPLKMCATSSSEGITIIETESGNYGVTPADEEGFKAALGVKG
ncbi:MAG: PH domain-containing protein [Chloroflexia bacterium]